LQQIIKGRELDLPELDELWKTIVVPDSAQSYLKRMQLDAPQNPKELLMQRALVYGLASVGAI
jgi:hypothetical protein